MSTAVHTPGFVGPRVVGDSAAEHPQTKASRALPTVPSPNAVSVAQWQRAVQQDPAAVVEALALLHRPVHDRDALTAVLQVAVGVVVRHVAGVDHASVTTGLDRGGPHPAASSGLLAWDFDAQQLALGGVERYRITVQDAIGCATTPCTTPARPAAHRRHRHVRPRPLVLVGGEGRHGGCSRTGPSPLSRSCPVSAGADRG